MTVSLGSDRLLDFTFSWWSGGDLDGDHLVCVVSEQVPEDYLAMLREKGISHIVSGQSSEFDYPSPAVFNC